MRILINYLHGQRLVPPIVSRQATVGEGCLCRDFVGRVMLSAGIDDWNLVLRTEMVQGIGQASRAAPKAGE